MVSAVSSTAFPNASVLRLKMLPRASHSRPDSTDTEYCLLIESGADLEELRTLSPPVSNGEVTHNTRRMAVATMNLGYICAAGAAGAHAVSLATPAFGPFATPFAAANSAFAIHDNNGLTRC